MASEFRNEPEVDFGDPDVVQRFEEALAAVGDRLGATYPLIIGGEEVATKETFDSINPTHPDQVVGVHARGGAEHVAAAITAAEAAFSSWAKVPAAERADYLYRVADMVIERRHDLGALMVYEVGKSWAEADGEIAETADLLRWYAGHMLEMEAPQHLTPVPGERTEFFYVPLGVGAIISPWNFPFALTTGMMSAGIVTGNTVVVKPASTSATSVCWLADLFREAGLPPGVLNLVTGPGDVIGDALVDDPRVRFVAFTGSKEVGVRIMERASKVRPGQIWLKRVQLEMGGKNAVVVDETADLDAAAEGIVASAFGFQGQKCSAGSRAIVVDEVYDELVAKVVDRASGLTVGDPINREVEVGPVIDRSAHAKLLDYLEVGKGEGKLVLGGSAGAGDGYFIEPTIYVDVAGDATLAQEEMFGPVLTFTKAVDFDDALAIANGTEFGLTGSLYTSDQERIDRARWEFHVGNLYINRKSTGALMGAHPFGGFNMSGTDSKAGGPDYLLFYMQGKSYGERIA